MACACSTAPTLLFPCSGGSDCGAVTDQAARQMTRDGIGKMYCLAGIAGRVEAILTNTKAAGKILAIDGCGLDCARKTLELADISDVTHLRLNDLGMEKGKTPPSPQNITTVVTKSAALLADASPRCEA